MAKTVAVIGAGASGLTAMKCCLDEGLQPICFERSEDIGGLWRFQENDIEGQASIYKSLTINTSKEMMSYSDFPIPEDFPNYMHHSKVMEYFRMYAKHFDLLKHIRFKTSVCSVKKCPDFAITGQWEVVAEIYGKHQSSIVDAVLVCTGHHIDPYLPLDSFPGIEKFKGKIIHSREYKNPEKFRDQRLLVIGLGNSGADISVDLSHVTKQVFLSTRTGTWVVNRVSDDGYPLDVVHFTRFKNLLSHMLPTALVNMWGEKKLNKRFNHENYGLKPQHRLIGRVLEVFLPDILPDSVAGIFRGQGAQGTTCRSSLCTLAYRRCDWNYCVTQNGFLSRYPIAADDLPNAIIAGRVIMKPNVKEFTERGVVFEDGTREENVDVVIFATGYSYSFPFIEDGAIQKRNNQIPLYKYVFPPHLEKPTLAIIGLLQPLGAIMPVSELQARWATRVFKGLITLPSEDAMMADIMKKIKYNEKRYVPSHHLSLQVQYVDHVDELASLAGVKPNLLHLFLTDPRLGWEVFFGPCSSTQFRLMGPGKWDGARNAILNQKERIVKATKTRALQNSADPAGATWEPSLLVKVIGCIAIFAAVIAYM